MSVSGREWLELALLLAVMAAAWRLVPLAGWRRLGAIGLRAIGLLCALLALKGLTIVRQEERPQHAVYLADQSASIDPARTEWIARRIASLESLRPRGVSRAVMAFGTEAQVVSPTAHDALLDAAALQQQLASAPVHPAQTNLEAALLSAVSMLPSHERGRVILLTDGRQTAGSVERLLPYLHRFGLEVYPVPIAPSRPAGLVWEQVVVPPAVRQGAAVPVQLVLTNGTARAQPLDVTVSLQGLPIARRQTRVRPGSQIVSLSVPALKTGTMRLEVTAATPGAAPQRRTAVLEVEGAPRVLLVLERPTELPVLATALKRREMTLSVTTPRELPAEAGKLLEHDAVLLYHLPKSVLSDAQVGALRGYVERLGGGLVMVGLGGTLDFEVTHEAPLDPLLPVVFEPKGVQEAKRRVCIVLAIDRSASMMGPRIAATKRGAVELVKQLAPEDLVGVLAFDTTPYVVVEVQPAGQVTDTLIDKLVRLKSTGGTDVLPALKAAQARLEASGATMKHIILLSDGNTPFNAKAYRQLLSSLAQSRVTISTIGIGAAFVNADYLEWLAAGTGGTFYQMRQLDELPRLIARDTQKTLGELPFSEGYFRPVRAASSEWFSDTTDWPPLKGFLTATAKPGAVEEVVIRQPESPASPERFAEASTEPLLVHWPLGLGRVAVFTSDADARWSPDWVRWPGFESAWGTIVQRVMRERPAEELFVWLETHDPLPHLVIEGELSDPSASLFDEAGTQVPVALVQHSRYRWRAPVSHVESGWYRLVVESRHETSSTFVKRWVQIGRAERGAEQPDLPPDEALLRRIAQATQGAYDLPDRAFLPPTQRMPLPVPLRAWLLPLALLLLLGDVALRGRTML